MNTGDIVSRYVWLADTIQRHGPLSRKAICDLWERSSLYDGRTLSRKTIFNYRQGIREVFDINIECNPGTFEYYIADNGDKHSRSVTDWLLNSNAVGSVLQNARSVAGRIFLEDIPSARDHLGTVIEALKTCRVLRFDYHNYTRSRPTADLRLEPYLLRLFRQRWYVVGLNIKESRLKTYALDRMSAVRIDPAEFVLPEGFDPEEYFNDSFGIVVTQQPAKQIVLRTDPLQAKYLRALPLHHSQTEALHDGFSLFYYNMRLTDDLVEHLLSYGPRVTVLQPPELRAMMVDRLRQTLQTYTDNPPAPRPGALSLKGRAALLD